MNECSNYSLALYSLIRKSSLTHSRTQQVPFPERIYPLWNRNSGNERKQLNGAKLKSYILYRKIMITRRTDGQEPKQQQQQ